MNLSMHLTGVSTSSFCRNRIDLAANRVGFRLPWHAIPRTVAGSQYPLASASALLTLATVDYLELKSRGTVYERSFQDRI
uniref:Oxidoreductase n=1 Tax=Panagrellus redivivus TaxID=6233 RepID=A0A7E4W159_PANRE